jgi:hypothetical protein
VTCSISLYLDASQFFRFRLHSLFFSPCKHCDYRPIGLREAYREQHITWQRYRSLRRLRRPQTAFFLSFKASSASLTTLSKLSHRALRCLPMKI